MTRRSGVRHTATAASLVATAMVISLIPSTGAAAEEQPVDIELGYTCQFPSEEHQVDVQTTAVFPTTSEVGVPVEPSEVELELTIPEPAVAELAGSDDPIVSGTAELGIDVQQSEDNENTTWPELNISETPIPDTGALILTASGPVPPVIVAEPGEISFAAAGLMLDLALTGAGEPVTEPETLQVSCDPEPDQNTILATVPASAPGNPDNEQDTNEPESTSDSPSPMADDVPPECYDIPGEETDIPMCAYMTGYSNVNKLNGAVMLGVPDPGFLDILLESGTVNQDCEDSPDPEWECDYSIDTPGRAKLDLPAAESTLLTFGFMPVRAKVKMTMAEEYIHILSRTKRLVKPGELNKFALTAEASTTMSMRLFDVTVNGVPLNVGADCRTAEPFPVVLHGESDAIVPGNPEEYDVAYGGALRGFVDIPAFEGCGATEDLDPLLTGSISGDDNFIKMMQGQPCFETNPLPGSCPPEVPEPRR